MNLHDAYGAFLDKVALPVKFEVGKAYKIVSQGQIRLARCTNIIDGTYIEMRIYGEQKSLVGLQERVYGLNDHVRAPSKMLK